MSQGERFCAAGSWPRYLNAALGRSAVSSPFFMTIVPFTNTYFMPMAKAEGFSGVDLSRI
jgi:hypothetical protein